MFASVRDIETDIQALNERFDEINKKYINLALLIENELIVELWDEFQSYKSGHRLDNDTILSKYEKEIKQMLN